MAFADMVLARYLLIERLQAVLIFKTFLDCIVRRRFPLSLKINGTTWSPRTPFVPSFPFSNKERILEDV